LEKQMKIPRKPRTTLAERMNKAWIAVWDLIWTWQPIEA